MMAKWEYIRRKAVGGPVDGRTIRMMRKSKAVLFPTLGPEKDVRYKVGEDGRLYWDKDYADTKRG